MILILYWNQGNKGRAKLIPIDALSIKIMSDL